MLTVYSSEQLKLLLACSSESCISSLNNLQACPLFKFALYLKFALSANLKNHFVLSFWNLSFSFGICAFDYFGPAS